MDHPKPKTHVHVQCAEDLRIGWEKVDAALKRLVEDAVGEQPNPTSREAVFQLMSGTGIIRAATTTLQRSCTSNVNAKIAGKAERTIQSEVSNRLVEMVMVLLGCDLEVAYKTVYKSLRPIMGLCKLTNENTAILRKLFGDFKGEDLSIESLEAEFLVGKPHYNYQGTKRKRENREPAEKIILAELVASLPPGFAGEEELRIAVDKVIAECRKSIDDVFLKAGHGWLGYTQVDSILVGSVMAQYAPQERFGDP